MFYTIFTPFVVLIGAALPMMFSADNVATVGSTSFTACAATDDEDGTCCAAPGAHCVLETEGGTLVFPNTQYIAGGRPCVPSLDGPLTRWTVTPKGLCDVALQLGFIAGCRQADRYPVSRVAFSVDTLATHDLEGRPLVEPDVLEFPQDIAVGTQYILVGDAKASHPLLVFDRFSGALVSSAGAIGRGPREISGDSHFDFESGQDEGWLLDIVNQSLIYVHLDSLVATGLLSMRKIRLDADGVVLSTTWAEPDSVIGWGVFPYGGIAVFDTSGAFHHSIGGDPPGEDDVSMPVRNHAWRKTLRASPDDRHFVAAYYNTDRLDLYEGSILKKVVRGPEFFDPIYKADEISDGFQVLALLPENRNGYVDVSVTDALVFALYSGKKRVDTSRGEERSSYILVFDWTGQPVGQLIVPGSPFTMAVSADNRDLYATYLSPVPQIIHFPLPEVLIH